MDRSVAAGNEVVCVFFFSSRRRHTRCLSDWSSDVCSSDWERAFTRLSFVENRRREPWVLESLQYLNHPLREAHARRFVLPALGLLREIQRTGDIFFPTRWMESTLGGHTSPEVAGFVEDFLARELGYPQRLRWTILTAADEL